MQLDLNAADTSEEDRSKPCNDHDQIFPPSFTLCWTNGNRVRAHVPRYPSCTIYTCPLVLQPSLKRASPTQRCYIIKGVAANSSGDDANPRLKCEALSAAVSQQIFHVELPCARWLPRRDAVLSSRSGRHVTYGMALIGRIVVSQP